MKWRRIVEGELFKYEYKVLMERFGRGVVRVSLRLSPAVYLSSYPYSNFTLRTLQFTVQNNVCVTIWVTARHILA